MHQLHQASGDGQSQACTSVLAGDRTVGLREGFEDDAQLARRDTDTRVVHSEVELNLFVVAGLHLHSQRNLTFVSELDGISNQIGDN